MVYSKNFDIAYDELIGDERGYANVPGDRGLETYCGIAYAFHPEWDGWPLVRAHMPLGNGQIISDPVLKEKVKRFYYNEFWLPVGSDQVEDLDTAKRLFNFGVKNGQKTSLKTIQQTLGIPATGKVDAATINAINNPEKYMLK